MTSLVMDFIGSGAWAWLEVAGGAWTCDLQELENFLSPLSERATFDTGDPVRTIFKAEATLRVRLRLVETLRAGAGKNYPPVTEVGNDVRFGTDDGRLAVQGKATGRAEIAIRPLSGVMAFNLRDFTVSTTKGLPALARRPDVPAGLRRGLAWLRRLGNAGAVERFLESSATKRGKIMAAFGLAYVAAQEQRKTGDTTDEGYQFLRRLGEEYGFPLTIRAARDAGLDWPYADEWLRAAGAVLGSVQRVAAGAGEDGAGEEKIFTPGEGITTGDIEYLGEGIMAGNVDYLKVWERALGTDEIARPERKFYTNWEAAAGPDWPYGRSPAEDVRTQGVEFPSDPDGWLEWPNTDWGALPIQLTEMKANALAGVICVTLRVNGALSAAGIRMWYSLKTGILNGENTVLRLAAPDIWRLEGRLERVRSEVVRSKTCDLYLSGWSYSAPADTARAPSPAPAKDRL